VAVAARHEMVLELVHSLILEKLFVLA
jgi:hypothetical protein